MEIKSPDKLSTVSKSLIILLMIIFAPVLIIGVFLYLFWGIILYIAIWLTWKHRFVLLVHSDSPIWKDYIDAKLIPKLQDRAVILNWSTRRAWKNSLDVLAFRYFGGYRNFNPLVLVFRPFRLVKDYRFYKAFKEFKHGKPDKVDKLTRDLFDNIGD